MPPRYSECFMYDLPRKMSPSTINVLKYMIGRVLGWLSWLSVRLQLRPWTCGPWVWAPFWALCWGCKAWGLLQILSLSLSLPLSHSLCLSVSLSQKINTNINKKFLNTRLVIQLLCDYLFKSLNSPSGHIQVKNRSKPSQCETEIQLLFIIEPVRSWFICHFTLCEIIFSFAFPFSKIKEFFNPAFLTVFSEH